MFRLTLRAASFRLVTCATILIVPGISAQAVTIEDTGAGAYWGGLNQYNPSNGDVIGTSDFAVASADFSRSADGNTLNVVIHTGYAGLPGTAAAEHTTYGSLFFAPTWSPISTGSGNGAAPHYSTDVYQQNDWTAAFVMNGNVTGANASGAGSLYSTGTVTGSTLSSGVVKSYTTTTGKIVMSNVNGNPVSYPGAGNPGYYFRQGQAVQFEANVGLPTLGTGIWTVDAANDIITFSIVDNGALGVNFAVAWAMTCANDVIQGYVEIPTPPGGNNEVPLPGAFLLMGSMLFGAGGFSKWRQQRRVQTTV